MTNANALESPFAGFFENGIGRKDDLRFDRLVSPKTAARLLDVSVKFIYECIARNDARAGLEEGQFGRLGVGPGPGAVSYRSQLGSLLHRVRRSWLGKERAAEVHRVRRYGAKTRAGSAAA